MRKRGAGEELRDDPDSCIDLLSSSRARALQRVVSNSAATACNRRCVLRRHLPPQPLTRRVPEIGWAHGSDDSSGFDSSFNAWNYGVGGRYTGFSSGRVWAYGQVIIGAETLHTSVDVGGVDVSDSQTSFML
jgi:hypothetical protein